MAIRKDDPAYGIKDTPLDHKGFPVGGNIESDDDTGFNRQLPPGQFIQNQMLNGGVSKIAALKLKSASSILASGTAKLD